MLCIFQFLQIERYNPNVPCIVGLPVAKFTEPMFFVCDQCKVCLCLDCVKVFHTEADIVGIKGELNWTEASEAKRSRARKEV
jgi:hypothetical protein